MKKSFLVVAVALTVGLNIAVPTRALAQELNLGPIIDPSVGAHAAAQQHVIEDMQKRGGGRSKNRSGRRKGAGKRRVARPVASGSTRFRPDLAARRRTVAAWTTRTRAANPQIAANLKRDLAGRDPIVAIGSNLARYGLRTDDLADVTAVYLVSSWEGMRGKLDDPSYASVRATRAQMHRALLSNRRVASASNATKQQLADALLLQMVVDDQSVRVAKGNAARMTSAKNAIRQNVLRTLKVDLAKMKLTDRGLQL